MSSRKREWIGKIGLAILKGLSRSAEGKPTEVVHAKGARVGRMLSGLVKKRVLVMHENLSRAFPEMSSADRDRIIRENFEHFGAMTADFLQAKNRTLAELEEVTDYTGLFESLDQAMDRGKGAILVSGHLGNWERLGEQIAKSGRPICLIIRDANTDDVNDYVNQIRLSYGCEVIGRGKAARPILERLKKNQLVGILSDQNSDDALIDFFGYPAGTAMGAGVLSERSGAPVVAGRSVHLGNGRYNTKAFGILEPVGDNTFKGEATMRAFNLWLEGQIRENPSQWLWMHDRWRYAKEKGLV